MSRIVTEIVVLTLNPSIDLTEPIQEVIAILSRQEGFRLFKWGKWEEDENKIQLFINWTDISFHQKFIESPDYPVLFALLGPIIAAEPAIIHAHFDEATINKILSDPVVELATFYSIRDGFAEAIDKTLSVGAQSPACLSYTRADVVEELSLPEGGEKVKAHYAAISWKSIEERWKATEREDVRQAGRVILGNIGGYEVHHVRFQ
ncbi:hypothetical protein BDV12DRAFT_166453 [Aspergillus spectabilis]